MEHHGPHSWVENIPIPGLDPHLVHVNGGLLVFLFILVVSLLANRAIKGRIETFIVPPPRFSLVHIVDIVVGSLYGMISGILGKADGKKYFPFIGSIFLFVFFSNFLGLLPLGSAPTSNTSTTVGLGVLAFLYYNYMGIRSHGLVGYIQHFTMGLGFIGLFVAAFELLSHAIRPVSLGVRLFVNMHVDHAVLFSFMDLLAWVLPVPLLLFGMVVCTIQAFVFAVLTAVYVQMAVEH